ncbi:hypothetical protein AMATHDRAFT_68236 [Amanita thiersii Skay4041]|uniref:Secreted protein n=1 Tax=Amanita thiersii Skay4041 TaxID=703135 RepID=A0A2A9N8S1_9AGAR|nr:hypothetical protein AMATHDRAFT_68236 [Amanita thiersii Skay4041]
MTVVRLKCLVKAHLQLILLASGHVAWRLSGSTLYCTENHSMGKRRTPKGKPIPIDAWHPLPVLQHQVFVKGSLVKRQGLAPP